MKKRKGFTLPEILTATTIFGVIMTLAVTLFVLSQHYYIAGSQQVDVQFSSQATLTKLVTELRESNPSGFAINASNPYGIVFISARDASGVFQIYNGLSGASSNCTSAPTTDVGKPCWQKWICYYLSPQTGTPYQELIRKEGDSSLPGSTFSTTTVSTPSTSWVSSFQSASLPQQVVAQNLQSLKIQDINCGLTGNPLYLQVVAQETYGGLFTLYNPGIPIAFKGCSSTANWIPVTLFNVK